MKYMKYTPLVFLGGLLALLPNCGGNCCYKSTAPGCPAETTCEPAGQSSVVVEQAPMIESGPVETMMPAPVGGEEEFEELEEPKTEPSTPAVPDKEELEENLSEEPTETA